MTQGKPDEALCPGCKRPMSELRSVLSTPKPTQPESVLTAPWPDFLGQTIRHGDRLTHPNGIEFVAVRLNGFENESDAWRAVYDGEVNVSRLCLQIGDKGRAVLSRATKEQKE